MLQKAADKRGGCYVVDNLLGPDSAVAVRNCNFIHNGRSDPYSARNCHYSRTGAHHSRAVGTVLGAKYRHGTVQFCKKWLSRYFRHAYHLYTN